MSDLPVGRGVRPYVCFDYHGEAAELLSAAAATPRRPATRAAALAAALRSVARVLTGAYAGAGAGAGGPVEEAGLCILTRLCDALERTGGPAASAGRDRGLLEALLAMAAAMCRPRGRALPAPALVVLGRLAVSVAALAGPAGAGVAGDEGADAPLAAPASELEPHVEVRSYCAGGPCRLEGSGY